MSTYDPCSRLSQRRRVATNLAGCVPNTHFPTLGQALTWHSPCSGAYPITAVSLRQEWRAAWAYWGHPLKRGTHLRCSTARGTPSRDLAVETISCPGQQRVSLYLLADGRRPTMTRGRWTWPCWLSTRATPMWRPGRSGLRSAAASRPDCRSRYQLRPSAMPRGISRAPIATRTKRSRP